MNTKYTISVVVLLLVFVVSIFFISQINTTQENGANTGTPITENSVPAIINGVTIPLPQGAKQMEGEFVEENMVTKFYLFGKSPEETVKFYISLMPTKGWTFEQPIKSQFDERTGDTTFAASFANEKYSVQIMAFPNGDALEGITRINIQVVLK